jgi:hypothetical protein
MTVPPAGDNKSAPNKSVFIGRQVMHMALQRLAKEGKEFEEYLGLFKSFCESVRPLQQAIPSLSFEQSTDAQQIAFRFAGKPHAIRLEFTKGGGGATLVHFHKSNQDDDKYSKSENATVTICPDKRFHQAYDAEPLTEKDVWPEGRGPNVVRLHPGNAADCELVFYHLMTHKISDISYGSDAARASRRHY